MERKEFLKRLGMTGVILPLFATVVRLTHSQAIQPPMATALRTTPTRRALVQPHHDHSLIKITLDDILYIEGLDDYLRIYRT